MNTYYPRFSGQIQIYGVIFVKSWTLQANPFAPTDNVGIEAQTNQNPQAFFGDHYVVAYGGKFYDPSYGSDVFATQQAWEDAALDAFGAYINPALPNGSTFWIWKADPKGSTETVPQSINY